MDSIIDFRPCEHLSMPDEEIRARLKYLTGRENWDKPHGFPLAEIARRIKYPKNRLLMFRDGRDGNLPTKWKLYPAKKKQLIELLLRIECGMLTCIVTREHRIPKRPYMTSVCKTFIESDVPTRPLRPVHRILIDNKKVELALGASKEHKVMPSFLGAFGKNAPTPLPKKLLFR